MHDNMKSLDETREFQRKLQASGAYRTDPDRPRGFMGWSDTWYFLRVLYILYMGNRIAARGKYNTSEWARTSFSLLANLEDCGARLDISGMEHPVRLDRPVVYVGNHMSMVEGFILPAILNGLRGLAPVMKDELLAMSLVGEMMSAIDPIAVGRTSPREDLKWVLTKGRECLKTGRSVVIFPQSTRLTRFDPSSFNTLGVKLARAAGVPVIPLAIKTDFQKNGRVFKDWGPLDRSKTIFLRFGPPMEVEGSGKATNAKIIEFILDNLRLWGRAEAKC